MCMRTALLALAASAAPSLAQLAGTGVLVSTAQPSGQYVNTISIQNTGTTTVGTFWFGWIPEINFLPSAPTDIMAPPGWYGYVIPDVTYDTYSIEWYSYLPLYNIAPGGSLSGFGFTSGDSPEALQARSDSYPRYFCTDSYLYMGTPEGDPGYFFNVAVTVGGGGGNCGSADFDCDGDVGTDADIEAFFACIAGTCPAAPCTNSADFNNDGDIGTDADIEAFFRVLGGGPC
jgi:hypothetical protein